VAEQIITSGAPGAVGKKIERFDPLIAVNDKQTFITPAGHQQPARLDRQVFVKQYPLSVVDKETLKMIQVLRLHEAIDYTSSATGSAVLLRSLVQPSTDLHHIQSKQESVSEIAANDGLRRSLQDYVHEYSAGESALYKFFNKDLLAMFPYIDVKRARKSANCITSILQSAPPPKSSYLQALMSYLHAYKRSSIEQMMAGTIYQTFGGLKSGREVRWFTPKLAFVPRRFSRWMFAGPAVAAVPLALQKTGFESFASPLLMHIGIAGTGLYAFYSLFVKPVRDTGKFIEPLRKKCIDDPAFSRAVDAVGMIDELLSICRFGVDSPHATTLPQVADGNAHFFEAKGLKNPVLAKTKTDVVPNDIRMSGTKLTFISGPNSGGKTTICKSIVHNQLLAQMGSYVLAEKAAINVADRISYQAPKFDGLQDEEGRFGTELSRTRDIFYTTGPQSLVILDELAEGTTHEEKLHESHGILSDFHTIGNNTVLVTHNHLLVDRFMKEQKGQCLMVEFNGDNPTYRVIPGISRVSHADRIAKKIAFSREDRHRYMKEKGYL
jgi:DNA mismatch repair ATPase MutS